MKLITSIIIIFLFSSFLNAAPLETHILFGPNNHNYLNSLWKDVDTINGSWWGIGNDDNLYAVAHGGTANNLTSSFQGVIKSVTALSPTTAWFITDNNDLYQISGSNNFFYLNSLWQDLDLENGSWWGLGVDGNLYAAAHGGAANNLTSNFSGTIKSFNAINSTDAWFITDQNELYRINGQNQYTYVNSLWQQLDFKDGAWWGIGLDGYVYSSAFGGISTILTPNLNGKVVNVEAINQTTAYLLVDSSPVPEPQTYALFLLGMLGLGLYKKRQKKA